MSLRLGKIVLIPFSLRCMGLVCQNPMKFLKLSLSTLKQFIIIPT
jgi:hypothetical protein